LGGEETGEGSKENSGVPYFDRHHQARKTHVGVRDAREQLAKKVHVDYQGDDTEDKNSEQAPNQACNC